MTSVYDELSPTGKALLLGQRVLVKEIDTLGVIYERLPENTHLLYGVRLDERVWTVGGFCTDVWHCREEGLEAK